MQLGNRIRELREERGVTQGQLAAKAQVSQGYLSQLENGDVRNPSAGVLLRVADAMKVEPDDLFEAAGYPTVRALRQLYAEYEASIDPDLVRYLGRLTRDKQRRLLFLLEGMENLLKLEGKLPEEATPATAEIEPPAVERADPAQDLLTRLQG
ncbi:MAG TPA: helix-turn-helix transcriptional regulator [Dehalococcoidia bacterium]|nr:helix-turn-helix transcriptional regulator [Dehalococcoidia bacterium]